MQRLQAKRQNKVHAQQQDSDNNESEESKSYCDEDDSLDGRNCASASVPPTSARSAGELTRVRCDDIGLPAEQHGLEHFSSARVITMASCIGLVVAPKGLVRKGRCGYFILPSFCV